MNLNQTVLYYVMNFLCQLSWWSVTTEGQLDRLTKFYFVSHRNCGKQALIVDFLEVCQTVSLIFAGPKRGRPTPGFSIFIHSD